MTEDSYTMTKIELLIERAKSAPSGDAIVDAGVDILLMLVMKNISYGNSALEYDSIFGDLTAQQALYARINDKLARIKNNQTYGTEGMIDAIRDLTGYLILLLVLDDKNRD